MTGDPGDLFDDGMQSRAVFSRDGQMRLSLTRQWAPTGPMALVIGCNPSTADAHKDDPTSMWWNRWFQHFGFRGYTAMNLYPFVASSPAVCRHLADWERNGPDWYARDAMHQNAAKVAEAAKTADQVFACWGAIAWDPLWIDHVVAEVQEGAEPWPDIYCWGLTKHGAPKHPLARGKHRIPPLQPPLLWKSA